MQLVASINSNSKNIILWVAGNGRLKKFRNLADSLGIVENIKFLGAVENIAAYYQTADFMVLPTKYDPFSNSCLEAMSCGCAVLTTTSNGASELLSKECLFRETDQEDKERIRLILVGRKIPSQEFESNPNFKKLTIEYELSNFLRLLKFVVQDELN